MSSFFADLSWVVFGLLLLLFEPFGPWMVVTLPVINVGTAVVGSSPKTLTQWSDHPKKLAAVHNLQIFPSILLQNESFYMQNLLTPFSPQFVVWQKLVKNLTHIFLFAYLSEILTISLNLKFLWLDASDNSVIFRSRILMYLKSTED